jgi:hypothetical protein
MERMLTLFAAACGENEPLRDEPSAIGFSRAITFTGRGHAGCAPNDGTDVIDVSVCA